MKLIQIIICSFLLIGCAANLAAQTEKKEIRKEVKLTEENGVKTLIIVTTENGKTHTQTFKGADADAEITRMQLPQKSGEKSTVKVYPDGRKEIRVEKAIIKEEKTKKEDN